MATSREDRSSIGSIHAIPSADSTSQSSSNELPNNTTSSSRQFHVYHATSHRNLTVTTEDKSPLFFVKNSSFTPRKPDVTFHAGTDQKAPIAAVCKFIHFSGYSKVGLGDPDQPYGIVWEDFVKKSLNHSEYQWQMTIYSEKLPKNTTNNYGERRPFTWKRTRHVGIGDSLPFPLSERNFKLVDPRTNELLAVYANNGNRSLSKCGKFQINVDYGRDFDTMVLITGLSLLEKQRRRERHSSGGGGGGGGGGG